MSSGVTNGQAGGVATRRRALLLAAPALAAARPGAAQSFPTRPIRMIVPIGPGSASDILARVVAEGLATRFGVPVPVENRAGAGGVIGAEVVARAAPDGHTLLMGSISTHGINPTLYPRIPYDAVADFAPVAFGAASPNVLVVHPDSPFRGVADILAAARARPGELTYSSGGAGTSQHFGGVVMEQLTGVRLSHVPFRSTPESVNAVIAQNVTMTFASVPVALSAAQGGRLRPLGLSGTRAMPGWPEVRPLAEVGLPGFDVVAWFGFLAPARTPDYAITRLHEGVREVLAQPAARERVESLGMQILDGSPAEFGEFMRREIARWAPIVRASGATAD